MSEGYVKSLLDPQKTLSVLQTYPLCTGDLNKDRLVGKEKRDALNALLLSYEHVPAADRICWFDLRPEASLDLLLKLELELNRKSTQFKSGTIFKTAKTLRPCFYLPYRLKGTTRMKLEEPPGWNGGEVSFFATATIDGCSVYIEGDPAAPKVTHANAQHVRPTKASDTYAEKLPKIQAKIQDMDARYAHLKKGAARVVERPNYMVEDPADVVAVKTRFAQARGLTLAQVEEYAPFGAVVGVKHSGQWQIFLQQSGTFYYRPVQGQKQRVGYFVLNACEIWPNGPGVGRTIP